MSRKRTLSKLPKVVGIYADQQNQHYPWIEGVVTHAKPRTVFVTTFVPVLSSFVRRRAVVRGDVYLKEFLMDPREREYMGYTKTQRFQDYAFLSYIKMHKGLLFIIPYRYADQYLSKRTEALMVMAHELAVKYIVIESESNDQQQDDSHQSETPEETTSDDLNLFDD